MGIGCRDPDPSRGHNFIISGVSDILSPIISYYNFNGSGLIKPHRALNGTIHVCIGSCTSVIVHCDIHEGRKSSMTEHVCTIIQIV